MSGGKTDKTDKTDKTMTYAKEVGARLRAVRNQQSLSLADVEGKSHGRWKTAAVGSYERGDRMVTVQTLSRLAEFYGVPMSALLPGGEHASAREAGPRVILDLEVLLRPVRLAEMAVLRRWVGRIRGDRGDWAGQVLTIRADDLYSLAVMHEMTPAEFMDQLAGWGVLYARGGDRG
ncbi:transcriptional regulator [Frankia sp. Cr1]|uniref:transcriptional regulator n=1 Tax=Frankia sp. Cr1 TaxID=3073931 RepID=UPI002AD478A3|nr:transcriptional regulator [Frankia sp. Cr1]